MTADATITLVCRHCSTPWTIRRRRGQYPTVCPACSTPEAAQARTAAKAEQRRRQRAAVAAQKRGIAKVRAGHLQKLVAVLVDDPDQALNAPLVLGVSARAVQLRGANLQTVRSQVVRVAHSTGLDGRREALVELSAVALAAAAAIPQTGIHEREAA